MTKQSAIDDPNYGATVVVTHRLRSDKHAEYEEWLKDIAPVCKTAAGFLDLHIIRPVAGLTDTYTVVIRFDSRAHLKQWIESEDRARLIEKAQPLFVTGDDFFIRSGLDFWFAPTEAKATIPVRWKQFLLTWSVIYPLVLGVPLLIVLMLQALGVPPIPPLSTLVVTGVIVFLMVYIIMPRYTRLVQRWLFS